jgi:hypothetical protein
MYLLFFALGAIGLLALFKAHGDTNRVRTAVVTASNKVHFHQMMGILIIVAHASEIGFVISHLSWLHMILALFLFALWLATRYGDITEELA